MVKALMATHPEGTTAPPAGRSIFVPSLWRERRSVRASRDKDRVAGIGKQVKGMLKEAAGRATGDTKTEAKGKGERAGGRVHA